MNDGVSSGLVFLAAGLFLCWWFFRILKRDLKKKEIAGRNVMMGLALLSGVILSAIGVAYIVHFS